MGNNPTIEAKVAPRKLLVSHFIDLKIMWVGRSVSISHLKFIVNLHLNAVKISINYKDLNSKKLAKWAF